MSSEKFENQEDEFQQSYEQVRRILEEKIPHAKGEERKKLLRDVDRELDDMTSLIGEMDMESRNAPYPYRSDMIRRMKEWRDKLDRISLRSKMIREQKVSAPSSSGDWMNGDQEHAPDTQRLLLIQGNASVTRASQSLSRAHQVAIETDEVGQEIISELGQQRESLVRVSDRLTDTDSNLKKSRKILKSMYRRVITNKIILIVIIIVELCVLLGIIYIRFIKPHL